MTPLEQSALTACLTLLGGCLLYVFSQFISKAILDPYLHYLNLRSDITYKLVYYCNIIVSGSYKQSPDRSLEAAKAIRDISARLRASVVSYPFPDLLQEWKLVHDPSIIDQAAGLLIRISNCMVEEPKKYDLIYEDYMKVAELLGINLGAK
jgi:hypothetical protein